MAEARIAGSVAGLGILIVDDEKDFARGLMRLISGRFKDVRVEMAHSGPEALEKLISGDFHLMLTDLRMPDMTGMELLHEAFKRQPDLCMVMLTAHGTIETAVEALKVGAYDFVTKPVEPDQLFHIVQKGLERASLLNENKRLRALVDSSAGGEMVGESPAMQRLRYAVQAVANSDYTVLIRGESGTGKEVVARLIHRMSNRARKPFMAVNCPAIPEHLLESELFGHVKGAFTGADQDRKGLFAAADGGTLLLDEVGDISANIQTKLLRVLQEGEVRPVGANANVAVSTRVLASTNQELEARIAERQFREDLYYRLNVLSVMVPPLRDRIEDIPLLAHHFMRQACRDMSLEDKDISPDVIAYLASRQWPGNVRELQSYIRRLVVFCMKDTVDMNLVAHVEHGTQVGSATAGVPVLSGGMPEPYKEAKGRVTDEFTLGYVRDLLTVTGGNISEAARISGLSRVALQKILSRLDIDATSFK
ncbi:sigma-54 dependent transcriptional regulator [Desulfovibrio mangrovi]|uniref:sigma-54-dependent transcriptional regulator n=1 Tax=Desulfovibrio mangrovi TaxID=2976983 RepID=UPI0022476625|nr:sigma-54 dependent transcriptional regulator [Desulfovibrio mangrovi]UZP65982.1 sigma-54 dependent transcriptional regulator [Desulfovibrio mangrovi]